MYERKRMTDQRGYASVQANNGVNTGPMQGIAKPPRSKIWQMMLVGGFKLGAYIHEIQDLTNDGPPV